MWWIKGAQPGIDREGERHWVKKVKALVPLSIIHGLQEAVEGT